jgi:hypothetical protein
VIQPNFYLFYILIHRTAVDEDVKKRHTGVKERTSGLCPAPHKGNFFEKKFPLTLQKTF